MKYSLSIILPFLNEINSLKKTLSVLNKIKIEKEFLIICSAKLTKKIKKEITSLKKKYKNLKCYNQSQPFVGGAIDLGLLKAKKIYSYYGFRFRN